MATTAFTSVPVLSLAAARDPSTKPEFLNRLRDALLTVGFMYIADTGLPPELVSRVVRQAHEFFDEEKLPLKEKERIEMKNEKSFLGWSRVSCFSLLHVHYTHAGATCGKHAYDWNCKTTRNQ